MNDVMSSNPFSVLQLGTPLDVDLTDYIESETSRFDLSTAAEMKI